MSAKKMLQVVPRTLTFTPDGGTATVFNDFAEAVTFTFEETHNDIASQSSEYSIGKLLTGRSASLKAVLNNYDLAQFAAVASGTHNATTDTLTLKSGSFDVNYGTVVFVGRDTATKKDVTVTLSRAVARTSGEMQFGKDSEVKLGVQFDAVRDSDSDVVVSIVYAV